ncbi:hypothetical protein K438DRAFT_1643689 [Mycena galopus ATCC 62051]|nr:hypothetical protein K438DRAFT_1643689 [Mycena galopus ATCC 62051]
MAACSSSSLVLHRVVARSALVRVFHNALLFRYVYCLCCNIGFKGVHRYQTKLDGQPASDRSSTSNLKKHAETCWGKDVVKARLAGASASNSPRDGNIFASFARTGQRPVKVSHRAHTEPEFRAHIVRWLAEANRPFRIMEDRELRELLLAGRPEHNIPSRRTIGRDLNAAFDRCSQRIINLLENYNGRLSFATDAWTSPNHRAFVAWTVHLQHEGQPLVFLLDVFEVPEVRIHLGAVHILIPPLSLTLAKFLPANSMRCWSVLVYSTRYVSQTRLC